jgi:hypothetical protein
MFLDPLHLIRPPGDADVLITDISRRSALDTEDLSQLSG